MGNTILDKYKIIETSDDEQIYIVEDLESHKKFALRKVLTDVTGNLYETAVKEFTGIGKEAFKLDKKPKSPLILDFLSDNGNNYLLLEYKDEKTLKIITSYPSLGKILNNRYLVVKGIASGGFGVVYMVRDLSLPGKCWALKEMHGEEGDSDVIERSFRIEAEMLSRLDSPNIPRISDFFVEHHRLYLVMDYVQGETIRKLIRNLKKGEHFTEERVVKWALTICDVMSYLHNRPTPIIFRDLKPDNIIITVDDDVRLVDFGIAKVFDGTRGQTTKFAILTEGYAPPEQLMGKAEPRSDIYAFGATIYHILSGKHPKDAGPEFPPVEHFNPSVSPLLSKILAKALEIKPSARYQSVREMKDELLKLQDRITAKDHVVRAREYEEKGDFFNANFEYMKVFELQGENYETLLAGGRCCEKMGLYDKALEIYNKALNVTIPCEIRDELLEKLKNIQEKLKQKDRKYKTGTEEKKVERKLKIRKFPGYKIIIPVLIVIIIIVIIGVVNYYNSLIRTERLYSKALRLYSQGDYKKAIACYDEALAIDRDFASAWHGRGDCLQMLKKYDEAIKCYDTSLSVDNKYVESFYDKGLCLMLIKRYDAAIACFDRVIELDPVFSSAYYNKGKILYEKKDYQDALKYFNKTLQIDEKDIDAWNMKGMILGEEKKFEESLLCFDKVLKISPENRTALTGKGACLEGLYRYDEAMKCYDTILEIFSDNDIEALRSKGVLLLMQGNYKESLKYFDRILSIEPSDINALGNKGFILCEENRYEEALEYLNKALAIKPDDAELLATTGDVLYKQEKYADALQYYNRSLKINGDNAQILGRKNEVLTILQEKGE
ncbi:MAG: tetratricopeptide repeat protein [Candidatus Eremiobacterota bacterium]